MANDAFVKRTLGWIGMSYAAEFNTWGQGTLQIPSVYQVIVLCI